MNKSVLISIRPEWCEKIASGQKTIEVRKTRPKIDTPFKCYIYETKGMCSVPQFVDEEGHMDFRGRGQVIGEFICDDIETIGVPFPAYQNEMRQDVIERSCLSYAELHRYAGHHSLYGWHISDLVIYDKPRELREFFAIDKKAVKECNFRERIYTNPDYTNGVWLPGTYLCNRDSVDPIFCRGGCLKKSLARPPQSWCYVEEIS